METNRPRIGSSFNVNFAGDSKDEFGLRYFSSQSRTGLHSESNPVNTANIISIQDFILKYAFDKVWVL